MSCGSALPQRKVMFEELMQMMVMHGGNKIHSFNASHHTQPNGGGGATGSLFSPGNMRIQRKNTKALARFSLEIHAVSCKTEEERKE